MKNKSVILVTHQLQYLQEADEILLLRQGKVMERGNFPYLLQNGTDFSAFLAREDKEEYADLSLETNDVPFPNPTKLLARLEPISESQASAMKDDKSMNVHDTSIAEEKVHPERVEEHRSHGSVKLKVYADYFQNGSDWFAEIFMLIMNILCQVLYSGQVKKRRN